MFSSTRSNGAASGTVKPKKFKLRFFFNTRQFKIDFQRTGFREQDLFMSCP